jgi:HEAT repeat protein
MIWAYWIWLVALPGRGFQERVCTPQTSPNAADQTIADMPERVRAQVKKLVDQEWNQYRREEAIEELGKLGPEAALAVPYILQTVAHVYELDDFINDRDIPGIPSTARDALTKIGPVAVPCLVEVLGRGDDLVRWVAAESLGDIGPAAKEAIPVLIDAVKRDSAMEADPKSALEVPGAAVSALARIGSAAVPALTELLKNGEEVSQRLSAASALREMGPVGKDAVPTLIGELKRAQERGGKYYRQAMIEALGAMGPSAREAVPLLTVALGDKDVQTRDLARQALEKIQGQK